MSFKNAEYQPTSTELELEDIEADVEKNTTDITAINTSITAIDDSLTKMKGQQVMLKQAFPPGSVSAPAGITITADSALYYPAGRTIVASATWTFANADLADIATCQVIFYEGGNAVVLGSLQIGGSSALESGAATFIYSKNSNPQEGGQWELKIIPEAGKALSSNANWTGNLAVLVV
jgi:hypothetical protein